MSRQAALNGCTESELILCAFLKSKQTTYDTSTLLLHATWAFYIYLLGSKKGITQIRWEQLNLDLDFRVQQNKQMHKILF